MFLAFHFNFGVDGFFKWFNFHSLSFLITNLSLNEIWTSTYIVLVVVFVCEREGTGVGREGPRALLGVFEGIVIWSNLLMLGVLSWAIMGCDFSFFFYTKFIK